MNYIIVNINVYPIQNNLQKKLLKLGLSNNEFDKFIEYFNTVQPNNLIINLTKDIQIQIHKHIDEYLIKAIRKVLSDNYQKNENILNDIKTVTTVVIDNLSYKIFIDLLNKWLDQYPEAVAVLHKKFKNEIRDKHKIYQLTLSEIFDMYEVSETIRPFISAQELLNHLSLDFDKAVVIDGSIYYLL